MNLARSLKTLAAAVTIAVALCSTATAATVLDNLVPPTFSTATGGDQIGAAIQIGSTPVTISTIEFHSFFTGGYVYRPGQTFAIHSRNTDGSVGGPLFTDFTMTPGTQQNARTTVTANSPYVLQANTGYWLVLSTPPGGNFVLWNFTDSTSYTTDFGVTIPAQRASFYTEKGDTFYFSLADGPQSARILGSAANAPAPVPDSVVSRKTHGDAGTFDIPLPQTGGVGVECRHGGASMDYQMVFTFPAPVTFQSAAVTSGTGSVASAEVSGSGNQVTVNLTGVANAQRLTVTLSGVSSGSGSGDVTARMGVLVGDASGNGSVNASDIGQVKNQSGQAVTAANFRADLVANGSINASDIGLVKSQSGNSLPPARGGVLEKSAAE